MPPSCGRSVCTTTFRIEAERGWETLSSKEQVLRVRVWTWSMESIAWLISSVRGRDWSDSLFTFLVLWRSWYTRGRRGPKNSTYSWVPISSPVECWRVPMPCPKTESSWNFLGISECDMRKSNSSTKRFRASRACLFNNSAIVDRVKSPYNPGSTLNGRSRSRLCCDLSIRAANEARKTYLVDIEDRNFSKIAAGRA